MRTTVDLDEDVLMAAKELARARSQSLGRVLSDTFRQGVAASPRGPKSPALQTFDSAAEGVLSRLGFEPLPSRGRVVSNELINQIRDDEGL